jgi:septum site-determining protein MinD
MTTTHANTPKECLSRLENLCLMAGMDLPQRAIREQIASAIQVIVQVQRLSDGSRKITHITEVQSMKGDDIVPLGDIFIFKETGYTPDGKILGEFKSPGFMPTFMEKFKKKGVKIPDNLFSNDTPVNGSNVTPLNKPNSNGQQPTPLNSLQKKVGSSGGKL